MAETTEEYRNRINQLKTGIENEPYIKKMRENIAEGISKTGNRQADIEVRQDKLEDDFVAVQQDARSNTPSGAELAVAAGSYNTLGERLDAEQNEINAQLAQTKADFEIELARNMLNDEQLRAYVDLLQQQLTNMGSISPAPFGTYAQLEAAHPDGDNNIYVVIEDGNWYYWNSISAKWTIGDKFQASGIANNSVGTANVKRNSLIAEHTDFITVGKNKFNNEKIFTGGYYQVDGTFVSLAGYGWSVVPVLPQTAFATSLLTDTLFINFRTADDKHISGVITNYSGDNGIGNVITTPANCYFMIVSGQQIHLDPLQIELGSTITEYEPYYRSVPFNKLDDVAEIYMGDVNIDFIKMKMDYSQLSVLKHNKKSTKVAEIPAGSKDISAQLSGGQFLFKITADDGNLYFKIYGDSIGKNERVIGLYNKLTYTLITKNGNRFFKINGYPYLENTQDVDVKIDGTGHFTILKDAIDHSMGSYAKRRVNIHLFEGEHDAFAGYSSSDINAPSFIGPTLIDYVKLIGEGDYMNVKLIGRLDTGLYGTETQLRVSPLNVTDLADVQNVSIIAKNTRYCLHDDYNSGVFPAHHKYKDVYLYKENGGGLPKAYGAGCLSGAVYEFDNVTAISEMGCPFSIHNNVNFSEKSTFILNNVKAYNRGHNGEAHIGDRHSMMFLSEGSNTNDEIIMIGCDIPDGIYQYPEQPLNTTGQIDFHITGHGNTIAPNMIENTDNEDYYVGFNEEIRQHKVNVAITKGQPIKFNDRGLVAPLTASDPNTLFIGVALKDAAVGASVPVRYKGFLEVRATNLTGLNLGDKIGIVNGQLSVVTGSEYIGVCSHEGFIRLV